MPIFTVIIPTYNRPDMLVRAVQSVLKQTFTDFDIVIVNDSSTISYSTFFSLINDPRIHYVEASSQRGPASTRNAALFLAKGKYVALLDDDDEYPDNFLSKTFVHLESQPTRVGVSFCQTKHICYDAAGVSKTFYRHFRDEYNGTAELFEDFLSIGTSAGVTFRRECLDQIGFFDEKMKTIEDTELFFRLVSAGFVPSLVPDVQMIIHEHMEPRCTDPLHYRQRFQEYEWLMVEYNQFLEKYPDIRQKLKNNILYLKREHLMRTGFVKGDIESQPH